MSSIFDPLGIFDEPSSSKRASKLAREQFEWQKEVYQKNYDIQKEWADREFAWNTSQILYQRQMDRLQMQREDEAVQRRVADLEAAGLSPTLAAGSAANSTPVHAGTMPNIPAPQHEVGVNPQIEVAMFKEQMQKEKMQLALSVLGNIADVSRTKAETELIKAQKDRYVAETPIELRLKTLLQEHNEVINPLIENQMRLNYSIDELKKDNQVLTNAIATNTVAQQALELIIKQAQADNAGRKYKSEADKLEEEVKEKSLAVQMAEHIVKFENEHGVPISAMSPVSKTFWPLSDALGNNTKKHGIDSFKKTLDESSFGQFWNKALSVSDKVRSKVNSFFTPKVPLVAKRKK